MQRQDQVANNLANVNTAGYKRARSFVEALDAHTDAEGAPRSTRLEQQWADLAPGPVEATGNALDVALGGEGFFVLQDEATGAARYTRAGRFTLGEDGTLRTPSGALVEGQDGPIILPDNGGAIEIDGDGSIRRGGQTAGRLRVVRFEDAAPLARLDDASFTTEAEPLDAEAPAVQQGALEGSNVNPVGEMADMIATFRLFEAQQKMLQSTDHLLSAATRDLGKF